MVVEGQGVFFFELDMGQVEVGELVEYFDFVVFEIVGCDCVIYVGVLYWVEWFDCYVFGFYQFGCVFGLEDLEFGGVLGVVLFFGYGFSIFFFC